MSERVALVMVEDSARAYDFGSAHPLRPERVLLTYERIRELGLLDLSSVQSLESRSASEQEITRVHDSRFVAAVRDVDEGLMERWAGIEYGLGTPDNPIFPDMHAAAAAVCGASLVAVEAVCLGRVDHSFNPAGGLHHARRREASGFCIYNDPAVAIGKVLELRPDWRVMYVDVDVHHGDGVQWIFYDEPRVLTVSVHQSGRTLYPGTGFEEEVGEGRARGTSANLPLPPGVGDEDYLWALDRLLPPLARAFEPDLLVTQLGADTHHGDPLANLALTMRAFPAISQRLHSIAHDYGAGRWVATGGGGYQATTVVPVAWAMHFAEMCGAAASVPRAWIDDDPPGYALEDVRAGLGAAVERVVAACVPSLSHLAATAS
jgi:acetoin utilization protein AcuC